MYFIEKIRQRITLSRCWHSKKLWMYVRLIMLLLLIGTLQSYAARSYSQMKKLSLSLKNVTVQEALSVIEQKSQYYFTYNTTQINASRRVSVKVKDRLITDILDDLFVGEQVRYVVENKHIVLHKDDETTTRMLETTHMAMAPNPKKKSGTVKYN